MMSEGGNDSSQSNDALLEELLYQFCRSDSLSEGGLREIIIERHGWPNNDPNINNYDFFRWACYNERVIGGILRYLLEYFPNAVRHNDVIGRLPLHYICHNKNVTLSMVQLLIDAYPDSIHHEDNKGLMPLHLLCDNNNLNKEVAVGILKLLFERCPESIRRTARDGRLPIHLAAGFQSPEFCRLLIQAYHGSERITNDDGLLPLHYACLYNTVATVEYLYQLYPESINVAGNDGIWYPIHLAIRSLRHRRNPKDGIEVMRLLLDCDPNVVVSQKRRGKSPLYWVCKETQSDNTSKLNAYLQVLQILYDAHPQAIESYEVTSNVGEFCAEVQTFINTQLPYARQARDRTLMHSTDENGQLPLHKAICVEVRFGSIKLLVKGNLYAVQTPDGDGALPLHLACLHYDDARIVEYLINLDLSTLRAFDGGGNTALHYACRGANHAIIALLLDKYGVMSVSKRNTNNQLPIDLLFASEAVSDKESAEYTESIYRLLKAYPETILNFDELMSQISYNTR